MVVVVDPRSCAWSFGLAGRLCGGVVQGFVWGFVRLGLSAALGEVVRHGCCLVRVGQYPDGRVTPLKLGTDPRLVLVIQTETLVVKCADQSAADDTHTDAHGPENPQDGADAHTLLRAAGADL